MPKNPEIRELLVSVISEAIGGLEAALADEKFTSDLHKIPTHTASIAEKSTKKLDNFMEKNPDLAKGNLVFLTAKYALLYLGQLSENAYSDDGISIMKYREYAEGVKKVMEDLKNIAYIPL